MVRSPVLCAYLSVHDGWEFRNIHHVGECGHVVLPLLKEDEARRKEVVRSPAQVFLTLTGFIAPRTVLDNARVEVSPGVDEPSVLKYLAERLSFLVGVASLPSVSL